MILPALIAPCQPAQRLGSVPILTRSLVLDGKAMEDAVCLRIAYQVATQTPAYKPGVIDQSRTELTSIRDRPLGKVSDVFLDQRQVDLLCHLVEKCISLNPRFYLVVLDDLLRSG